MNDYKIILKSEKVNKYNTIGWLFILFNIAATTSIAMTGKDATTTGFIYIILPGLLALFVHYRHLKIGNQKKNFDFTFLLLAIPWISLQLFWAAAVVILMGLLHAIAIRRLVIFANADKITYPSFPRRSIEWNELSNIILKDDLLTIDFKNNKIIQQLIDKTEHPVNEREFNDFCSKQLQSLDSSV